MLGVVVVLCGVLALGAPSSVNYCGAKMCGNTNAHTFCQFPEGPSPDCVGYIEAKLEPDEKTRLLDRLNSRRNEAAGGLRSFPPAGNMLTLRWVDELAREAQRWADQCRPPRPLEEHDACRNLYSLTVGQCVASVVGEAPGLRVESMVDIWNIQSMQYKGNVTFYMPPSIGGKYYGDFAQIIWAKSYMVGCGRSRFMTPVQGRLRSVERLVCNIAPFGPQPTRPLWAPAAPTASCPHRSAQSPKWPNLCDYQRKHNDTEQYDPSTTLEDNLLLNTILEIEGNETLGSIDEIYLTKLAIATMTNTYNEWQMDSFTTQTYFNSKQRREVVDIVDVIKFHANDSTVAIVPQVVTTQKSSFVQNTLKNTASATAPLQTETTTEVTKATQTEHELNWIGGPAIYNMEDLANFIAKPENIKLIEELLKKEKDFYVHANNEFNETTIFNETSVVLLNGTQVSNATGVSQVPIIIDDYENSFTVVDPKIVDDVTALDMHATQMYFNDLLSSIKLEDSNRSDNETGSDSSSGSGSGDFEDDDSEKHPDFSNMTEYFYNDPIDPETVRQLQEALEQSEYEMEQKKGKQVKVRRDLRDSSESDSHQKPTTPRGNEFPSNKPKDGNSLFDFFNFVPSMSETPNEYSSTASHAIPSLVIVLALCL
ncbi:unnamed protein product [Spodoptera littoralis]|uniref:SCP domain-containing protein n=1 Tax=Spodoptera littoralis TaxID=7109 RepID=A0A9P0NBW8_SPOLI|nr:unnamed protein product [Spodoptera littoralis]CAH1647264.1 unnamed protein product [Spodoptera littoralis]